MAISRRKASRKPKGGQEERDLTCRRVQCFPRPADLGLAAGREPLSPACGSQVAPELPAAALSWAASAQQHQLVPSPGPVCPAVGRLEGRRGQGVRAGSHVALGMFTFSLGQPLASSVPWAQCPCTLRVSVPEVIGTAALCPSTADRQAAQDAPGATPSVEKPREPRQPNQRVHAAPSAGAQQCSGTLQTRIHRPALPLPAPLGLHSPSVTWGQHRRRPSQRALRAQRAPARSARNPRTARSLDVQPAIPSPAGTRRRLFLPRWRGIGVH